LLRYLVCVVDLRVMYRLARCSSVRPAIYAKPLKCPLFQATSQEAAWRKSWISRDFRQPQCSQLEPSFRARAAVVASARPDGQYGGDFLGAFQLGHARWGCSPNEDADLEREIELNDIERALSFDRPPDPVAIDVEVLLNRRYERVEGLAERPFSSRTGRASTVRSHSLQYPSLFRIPRLHSVAVESPRSAVIKR